MSGTASRLSQMCIFIHAWALPSRQVRTFLRAASRPASTMHVVPATPNPRPTQLPPDGPYGRGRT